MNEVIEYQHMLGNDIHDMLPSGLINRHPFLETMQNHEAEPYWLSIDIRWAFPLFPLPRLMLRPEQGKQPNLNDYPDEETWRVDYLNWVYRGGPARKAMKLQYTDIVKAAEERNEKKRARYNDNPNTLGSIEYERPPVDEAYLQQKVNIQAKALDMGQPDPFEMEEDDFVFQGANIDLFYTKKFGSYIHNKLRDTNLSITAKRLYHFFNREDVSRELRFPQSKYWEQVALDRWFKPHKFNLDRLLLVQFFLGNGLPGNYASDLILKPYTFARQICKRKKRYR